MYKLFWLNLNRREIEPRNEANANAKAFAVFEPRDKTRDGNPIRQRIALHGTARHNRNSPNRDS